MVDPVSVGELAAHLAGQALLVANYIAKVREAPARSRALQDQLRAVQQLVEHIERTKGPTSTPLASLHEHMTEFRVILDELTGRIRVNGLLRTLMWPLKEADTERYLTHVERYKTTFHTLLTLHNM